ncbi:hypothetical protein ACFU44_17455 [Nocardia rhizosphaerihabitans]|uniref:hypothetical protein n=1 Tax=Nocardia rhizosphaerihabitans TaxID=1691570 RepID=UPI00367100DD
MAATISPIEAVPNSPCGRGGFAGDWIWLRDMCQVDVTIEWDEAVEQDIGQPSPHRCLAA